MSLKANIILFLILVAIIVAIDVLFMHQSEAYIDSWAKDNKYKIVTVEKPWFATGPFWTKDDSQTIYRVTVKDYMEKEYVVWFRLPKGLGLDTWAWDKTQHPQ